MEAAILQQYSLVPAANTTTASPSPPPVMMMRRSLLSDSFLAPTTSLRSLLQANGTNTTNATASPAPQPSPSPAPAGANNTTLPVWTYLSDYDTEAPLVTSFDPPAPLPMNYTFEQLSSPNGGNAVQDWLPLNNSITTYQGEWACATRCLHCKLSSLLAGACRSASQALQVVVAAAACLHG
jgi:hypothetical protein